MTRNKKTFRLTMLGLLCGGLLMVGVGAGVTFAEVSAFSYTGQQKLPDQAQAQSKSFEVSLEEGWERLYISSYGDLLLQLSETARIETSEDVEPGSVRIDLDYQTVGPQVSYSWEEEGTNAYIHLYWTGGGGMPLLLACKDQLLTDIQNRKISDYIAVQMTEAVITVNPADAERVVLE